MRISMNTAWAGVTFEFTIAAPRWLKCMDSGVKAAPDRLGQISHPRATHIPEQFPQTQRDRIHAIFMPKSELASLHALIPSRRPFAKL